MEINKNPGYVQVLMRSWILLFIAVATITVNAQNIPKYSIRDGNMFIDVSRKVKESTLDSFISRFDLKNLDLKHLLKNNRSDSMTRSGWHFEVNNKDRIVISKPFGAVEKITNPADKIIFTGNRIPVNGSFPATNNGVIFGVNKFRNKHPFAVKDSVVTFFLRNNLHVRKVMLAGSFNDWNPNALRMAATDSGWIAKVILRPGKYWYKFITDGNWLVDDDNLLKENDGRGNVNSIFFKTNVVFRLSGFNNARRVILAGSFNMWHENELLMNKTADGWNIRLYLTEGTHTYKFLVDGKWVTDDGNKERLPDGHNGYNSVISIGHPYIFKLRGHTDAKQVVLYGNFNKWRDDELYMKKAGGGWELAYTLGPGNYEYKYLVDGKWLKPDDSPPGSNKGASLVVQPNYTFHLKGHENASEVFVAGEFNNWDPASYKMQKEGNEWIFNIHLPVGKHLYKFLVDGSWIIDPSNKLWEQNEFGTGNSIVWIGQ